MTMYSATLTTAGQALYAAALAGGAAIALAQLAVGDGGGFAVASPDPTRTTLVNQVYRGALGALWVDPNDPALMWAQGLLGPTVGGFTIREVGLFTTSGVLFALANFPDTVKPVVATGSAVDLAINFGMKIANTALIALSVDASIVGATQAWVLSTITPAHLFPGGTQYQVLQKNSAAPGDMGWANPGAPWETTVAITGSATVLTPLQALAQIVIVTGVLTANASLVFPGSPGKWIVANQATGAFVLTAMVAGGSGVPVLQGAAESVYSDGVNLHFASSSAVTRPPNDGSQATATTQYVDRALASFANYSDLYFYGQL